MDWQLQLVTLYVFICNEYGQNLWQHCQRFATYVHLGFSDEEIMTVYLFGVMSNQYKIKDIYQYTFRHLREWFPTLPSYQAFVNRVNRLGDTFIQLIERLQIQIPMSFKQTLFQVIDSLPIIMAQGGRRFRAKVAPELATPNGYCATKKLRYYGAKLHVLAYYNKGMLPIPRYIGLTEAGTHDSKAYEQLAPTLAGSQIFADKAYQTENKPILTSNHLTLYTPVKKQKGQENLDAADKLLSTAISRIRQPIESLFSWIEEKTKIQMASKVRSYAGLMVHVFGKIAAAFYTMLNKLCP